MIQLSIEAKDLFQSKVKPYLKKNNTLDAVRFLKDKGSVGAELISALTEAGLVLTKLDKIPNGMFKEYPITTVTIPANIKSIGNNAFEGCSDLKSIRFEGPIYSIGKDAFRATSLDIVELPEGLEKVGSGAFKNCTLLKEIYLPDTLSVLSAGTFDNSSDVTIFANSRKGLSRSKQLSCPYAEIEWYKNHLKLKPNTSKEEN